MRRSWPYLLILTLGVNFVLAGGPGAGEARACSCAGTASAEEALQEADAVFSGEVVDVGKLPAPPDGSTTFMVPDLNPVTFDVGGAWKGVEDDPVVVHGEGLEASCGIDFDAGETYLVLANHVREAASSPLQTDFCGATEQIDEEAARQMLGPPASLPDTGGIPSDRAERWAGGRYVVATALLAALTAGALLARRTARNPGR